MKLCAAERICRTSVLHFRDGTMADLRKGRFYLMEKHVYNA